jgi:hypothetical protein
MQKLRNYGEVNVYYIEENGNAFYYIKIIEVINSFSPKRYPYVTPLIGIFKEDNLIAIIMGIAPENILQNILFNNDLAFWVYFYFQGDSDVIKVFLDQHTISCLIKMFEKDEKQCVKEMMDVNFSSVFAPLILAAINDALNLNNLYFLFLLFFIILFEKDALKGGFSFMLGIFVGRYSLDIFKSSWQPRYGILLVSLIIGILGILKFFGRQVKFSSNIFHKIKTSNLKVIFNCLFGSFTYFLDNPRTPYIPITGANMVILYLVYNTLVLFPLLIATLMAHLIVYRIILADETLKINHLKFEKWLFLLLGISIMLLCFLIL